MSEVTITLTEWEAGAARLALANELGLIRKQVELHEEEKDAAWGVHADFQPGTTHARAAVCLVRAEAVVERVLAAIGNPPRVSVVLDHDDARAALGALGYAVRRADLNLYEEEAEADYRRRSYELMGRQDDAEAAALHEDRADDAAQLLELLRAVQAAWDAAVDPADGRAIFV